MVAVASIAASARVSQNCQATRPMATNALAKRKTMFCPRSATAMPRNGQARSGWSYSDAMGPASANSRSATSRVTTFRRSALTTMAATAAGSPRRSAMNLADDSETPKSAGNATSAETASASARIPYWCVPRARARNTVITLESTDSSPRCWPECDRPVLVDDLLGEGVFTRT